MVAPTGGAYEYDYAAGMTDGYSSGVNGSTIYRRVVERRVYPDGASGSSYASRMTYSVPETGSNNPVFVGYVIVAQRDANNTLLEESRHYFLGPGAGQTIAGSITLSAQTDGRESKTEALDTDGSTVLRRTEHTWVESSTFGQGPYISQTVTALEPSGANLVAKQTYLWDRYNNQTDVYEYDYGSGAAGSLVRHTVTTYVTTNNSYDYACDPTSTCGTSASMSNVIHIRSLPSQVSLYDSGGTERARTTFEYDNYASDSNHAGLTSRSSISGLDSAFTTSLTTRGNATATTRYLLNSSGSVTGSISAYAQYDVAGNMVETLDGRGYATTFDFADNFGAPDSEAESNTAPSELSTPGQVSYAFARKVTNAKNQVVWMQFDYYLGKPVNAEDANGIVASGYYDDVLDRPTQVKRAVGVSGVENQTTFAYDDANRTVTTTSDQDSTHLRTSKALYDQLGRTTESRQYETSSNYIVTKRDYDAIGRAYRISNPYRPWNSESAVWTTNAYDALGRTVTTTSPDSAVVSTSYSGNTVTATDQAGKSRKSVTDGLGRLATVYEDPSNLNYSTSYTYDVLNNLTEVSQGSQTRTFFYDSLKRPTSSSNPESGTATVDAYDNNGNVLVATDARGVSTHVSYDELNRPTRRWYNGSSSTSSTTNNSPSLPSGVAATDEVAFYYDSQTLPSGAPSFTRGYSTGALVAITYGGGSAGTYRGYDAMGRVVRQYQQTDSVNYLVEATYNADSSVATETYPSVPGASDRRTVSFSYDGAGRLSSLSSSATSYAPAASVSSIGYASQNSLSTETYGNSLIHTVSYNNRLQPTEIELGTSSNSTSVVDLTYSYGTTSNNGNIQSISYSGGGLSYTQSFTYDSLNRLSMAQENSGTNWSQTNAYDRYGNRQIDYGGGSYNLSFSSTTNRITTSGFGYDSSGNLTNDGSHSYGFDADSKIKSVDSTTAYTYDGEGKRVKKLVGENTRFIYGIGGAVLAEYDGSSGNLKKEYVYGSTVITIEPTAVNSNGAQYGTGDHLGSPRVITNSSGSVVSRHDYKPFGEELGSGVGGRTTGMGFSNSGDNNRKKFTGYERDTETGLDFAQARFYGSTQGRFTSPDPFSASAIIADPQTFNRYAYCRNNPVNSVDPSGMSAYAAMRSDEGAEERRQASWQSGHDVIEEDEARYEEQVKEAFAGVQDHTIVTVQITTGPAGGTSNGGEHAHAGNSAADRREPDLEVNGHNGDSLSPGNPLRFPYSNKQTLGPDANRRFWTWQVEIVGTVPDDISTWKIRQKVEGIAITTTIKDGAPITNVKAISISEDMSSGAYFLTSQPRGQRRSFTLDAPGISRGEYQDLKLIYHRRVLNYTTYLENGNVSISRKWSISVTVSGRRGIMVGATFDGKHMPLQ
jgi:RHS repeat-associated protein